MNNYFIKASDDFCTFEKHVPAPYLRKEFDVDFVPDKAEISICGLGFYILYINGVDVTKGLLAPYISNPEHYCYYDTYDIKKHLKEGKNVIGVILGNGMMNAFGGCIWDFDKAENRGAPVVALELNAFNETDNIKIIADQSFKVHTSPIIFDDMRMGEYYDANLEVEGWNLPGFDDSLWGNALSAETPKGILKECGAEAITVRGKMKPERILKSRNGFIYDFGTNSSGLCKLKIRAKANQKIKLKYAEILDENMELDRQSIIFSGENAKLFSDNNQIDIYIAKGEGIEEYIPHFTYHGFRYVEVIGIDEEQATKELLTYYEYSSDLKTIGDFECSDDTVNTLFEMVKRSDISNFYYFPTDCPHREKNGWTGDASLSADHTLLVYDATKSWQEWLSNIRGAQTESGMIPGIIPTYTWGYEWGNGPAWDSALFNLPYVLYKNRGNTEVIKENENAMIRYLEYIVKRKNDDGTIGFGLGDWLPVGKNDIDFDSPIEVTDSITVMDVARKASEMFSAVGSVQYSKFADDIYREMRNVIREKLIDKETLAVNGNCQTSQAMALYYGVFKPHEEEKAFRVLMKYIEQKDNNFDCGILGMHVLFHVLSKFGQSELAYEMITKKEYPSYAHLIEVGETTLVESFKPDGVPCSSHNHHFFGDIGRWFINHIAGLYVIDSKTVEIKPDFISAIDYAKASYELPDGKVAVSWKRNGEDITLDVSCCDSVAYKITLPHGYIMEGDVIKKH